VISRFFIDRPIFAAVLSIVITLAGLVAVRTLPVAQFPQVSPPTVQVQCNYPGASAKDVAAAVAAPIEQFVNGVEGMMYMSSNSTNDGQYSLNVTFHHDIDVNMALVLVQNRVALATQLLPDVIKQTGVTCRKQSPDILMGIALYSPDRRYNQLYVSNYAVLQVKDELARIDGVADVFVFGQRDYSMRIWVNPEELAARALTASDVAEAIREQNMPVATGSVGQQPAPDKQVTQISLNTLGRLKEVDEFENIILKATPEGRITRLKDVARVELGAKSSDVNVSMDNQPTVFLAIFQMPDANALETHDRVMAKVKELSETFPEGLAYDIGFTTVPYTRESIREVFNTLRDAIVLVAFVVLLFLQNWRSAIIPLVAVPVAIIGTFAVMAVMGFSLNNLTLFGLVLAIGIVVDDAIVVVEAVEHHIDLGLSPREATIKAMRQVSGPVIAVGLVLSAVFVPCAFITGITGQFFRQFAMTIAVSTVISAFNSLTLSPALTAILLRPRDKANALPLPWAAFPLIGGVLGWIIHSAFGESLWGRFGGDFNQRLVAASPWAAPVAAAFVGVLAGAVTGTWLNRILAASFRAFDRAFRVATSFYVRLAGGLLRVSVIALIVYGGLLWLTWFRFNVTPKGFIPAQDMGYLLVSVQLPDAASLERTQEVMDRLVKIGTAHPGVKHCSGIAGQSFILNAASSNFGSMFVNLREYHLRRSHDMSSTAIADYLQKEASKIKEASIRIFPPPPIRGVGRAGGFMLMVEDPSDVGPLGLQEATDGLIATASRTPGIMFPTTSFRADVPQVRITPDPRQCMMRHVSLQDFADTLRIYQGSLYVNDFNKFGRTWQVIVQADPKFRTSIDDLPRLKVRNSQGVMVPIGSLASIHEVNGPLLLTRYNRYAAAAVNGSAAPGTSSNQAMQIMERLANEQLPRNMKFEWTDMSYLELLAGNTATVLFGFAVVMVFLVLAAQYESWSLPLAVILVVPMCLLCGLVGVSIWRLRDPSMDINIFTRVGFVVLVGLASKNAILIIEFARQQRLAGVSRREATLEACRLRLRPIVMTSFAFILGVVPMIIAHGAGAEMRKALGVPVFSGMIGVTLFGLVLTPVFFYVIDWCGESRLLAGVWLRKLNGLVLGAISLRPVRQLGRQVAHRISAANRKRAKAESPELLVEEPTHVVAPETVMAIVDETIEVPHVIHEVSEHRPHHRPIMKQVT
jgi:multidrug efflux pump